MADPVYDPKVTLKKALISFVKSAGAVAAVAVLGYIGDNATVTKLLSDAGVSTVLTALLVPLIHSITTAAGNWLKHATVVDPPNG